MNIVIILFRPPGNLSWLRNLFLALEPSSGNRSWLRTHFWQPLMASCKSPCAQMIVTASRKEVCAYGVLKLLHRVHYACVQYILLAPVAHGELQEGIAERNCQKELPEGIAGRNCRKELPEGNAGRNCRKESQ